jgi:hypothetical protein
MGVFSVNLPLELRDVPSDEVYAYEDLSQVV